MSRIISGAIKAGPRIIGSYFKWIIRYSKHPEKYPFELRYKKVRNLLVHVFRAIKVKYEINGIEEFLAEKGDENTLIVSNHVSLCDPVFFILNSEKPITFVAKKEIKKYPFIGKILTCLDGYFLERGNLRQEIQIMKDVERRLASDEKIDIIIFPEGTRNKCPLDGVLPFKYGSFKPALRAKKNVGVVCTYGGLNALDFSYKEKVVPVQLEYLKIIKYDEFCNKNTIDFAYECEKIVNDKLKELIKRQPDIVKKFNS